MSFLNLFEKILFLIVIFFFLENSVFASHVEIKTKKTELTNVGQQIKFLQKNIIYNKQQEINLQQQLKKTEISIGELNNQIQEINKLFLKEQKALSKLKKLQNEYEIKLQNQHNMFEQQIRSAYFLGSIKPLKLFINQEDMSALGRHLVYYRYLNQARMQLIENIKKTITSLARIINTTSQQEKNMQRLLKQKVEQQNEQKILLNRRQKLVTQLNRQTISKQEQLNSLLANQKILRDTITQLNRQSVRMDSLHFDQLRQKLTWPVKGALLTRFGSSLGLGQQNAVGVIIKAQAGAPVHAIYSGKVIFANWLRGLGLLIIINHGDNYMSLYARNQSIYTKVGDYVNSGDVIAAVGNTGGYQKTSLYFEIRQNGTPVNPSLWCHG